MNPCGNPMSSRGNSRACTYSRVGTGWPVTTASMPGCTFVQTHPHASVCAPAA